MFCNNCGHHKKYHFAFRGCAHKLCDCIGFVGYMKRVITILRGLE